MALSTKYMPKICKSLSPLKVTLEYLMAYVTSRLGCLSQRHFKLTVSQTEHLVRLHPYLEVASFRVLTVTLSDLLALGSAPQGEK